MRHVGCLHDLRSPLSIDKVHLVNLEPSSTDTSGLRSIIDGTIKHVRDRSRVSRVIPLDLDLVTLVGLDCLDAGWDLGAANVAGHVVARQINYGAVGGWHPDADLVSGRDIVDPKLVEVLVSRDGGKKSAREDGLGEHGDVCWISVMYSFWISNV